eukprot:3489150-Rhodomonas_salina.1
MSMFSTCSCAQSRVGHVVITCWSRNGHVSVTRWSRVGHVMVTWSSRVGHTSACGHTYIALH